MWRNPKCIKCLGGLLYKYTEEYHELPKFSIAKQGKCDRHCKKVDLPHNYTNTHNVPDGGADGHSTEKDLLGMK